MINSWMDDSCSVSPSIDDLINVLGGNSVDVALVLQLARFQKAAGKHYLNCLVGIHAAPETYPLRGQGQVIAMLKQEDGLPTKDLAARMGIRTASLNELLVKLEAKGLVERRRSTADGRVVEVYLTAAGHDVQQAPFINLMSNVFGALTTQEKETLSQLLDRLTRAIDEAGDKAEKTA